MTAPVPSRLSEGTRIRHRRYPELTGRISHLERCEDGSLSAIPYNVAWDNGWRAASLLGTFFIYASDSSIEADSDAS